MHPKMMELELFTNSSKILQAAPCKLMAPIIFLSVYSFLRKGGGRFYQPCGQMMKRQRKKERKY
jgi:hypothetical protein